MRFDLVFKLLLVLLAALASMTGVAPASAETGGLAYARAGDIGKPLRLCVARAVPGQTAAAVFGGHVPLDCAVGQASFGSGDFWVLADPINVRGDVAVRSASLWQARRTLHARYADGTILKRVSDTRQASRELQLGAIFSDRVPGRSAPLVRLLWRVDGAANIRGIVVGARTASLRESGWSNLKMAALYAAFGGLCVALLVHHLSLWWAMRHRFQLAYCLMIATLMIYALSSSGAIAWWWPDIDNNDRLRINYIGLALAASTAVVFARTFFEERVFAGAIRHLSMAVIGALMSSSLAFALLAPWHIFLLDRLFTLSFVALMAFVPVLLVRAWQKRSNFLWLFAIAWGAPVLFAGLRIASNFNLTTWSFWIDNSTVLSMTAEALLSSLAISYRIRMLSVERDLARTEESAARTLADIDPLTGLLNRRAFLTRAIGREGDQLLHVVDLDHFKVVNETIGHDGGDEVLRVVARVLRTALPADALVARIGGEEFALLAAIDRPIDAHEVLTPVACRTDALRPCRHRQHRQLRRAVAYRNRLEEAVPPRRPRALRCQGGRTRPGASRRADRRLIFAGNGPSPLFFRRRIDY